MARAIDVIISGSAAPLRKAIREATNALGGMSTGATLAFGAAATATTMFAKAAVQNAANLAETISKTGVVFGNNAKDVQRFAESAASSFGISKQAALDASSTFAIFGKSAGLSGKDLVNFSTNFVALASDLASFNNTSPEAAVEAIGAALRGESEPLRRYGVLLDDASMRQKALELGITSTIKNALTPQQKVLAAQALIFQQTTDAQGDFARTSSSVVNQQKILKARLADVSTEMGAALLPVVQTILPYFVNLAQWAGQNAALLGGLATAVGIFAGGILAARGALAAWRTIAEITRITNLALGLSFSAVQIATGVGIVAALAAIPVYLKMKDTFNDLKDSTNNYSAALGTAITSQAQLNAYMGPVPSRNLAEFQKHYSALAGLDVGGDTDKAAQAFKTFTDRVNSAKKAVREYVASITNAIAGSVNLGAAFSTASQEQTDATQALTSALEDRRVAYEELNQARVTNDVDAYNDALKRVATAEKAVSDAQAVKPRSYGEIFREQVAAAKEFAGNLKKLIAAGLGKAGLAQILDLGPVAGNAVAKDLLAGTGGLTVSGLNADLASVMAEAGTVGLAMPGVAAALTATAGKAGNTYQITVNAGVGDKVEIGKQVVAVLQAYEKRLGGVPIKVQ